MIPLLAQLDCAIEMTALDGPATARPTAIEHVIEFEDALTGEALPPQEVAAFAPVAVMGAPLQVALAEASPDGAALRRVYAVPAAGEQYTLRVEAADSRRYFGCERSFPVAGAASRQVRVALVPRARDVSVTVEVARGSSTRPLTAEGVSAVELRASAASEREVEVHRGRCSGERPATGSHWCVRSLAAEPSRVGLAASVPGYGVADLALDARATERTVALRARYDGHFMPSVVVRAAAAWAPLNGSGVGGLLAVDVSPGSRLHGATCPLADTCVVPVLHVGAGNVPYRREVALLGPGSRTTPDGRVEGDLGVFEVGGGVTVVPGGTGDALRFSLVASAALGLRGSEQMPNGDGLLSPAASRFGATGELVAAWRFAGPLLLHVGARMQWFPGFGDTGRRFSFLGNASASGEAASLMQVVLLAGLGVEP